MPCKCPDCQYYDMYKKCEREKEALQQEKEALQRTLAQLKQLASGCKICGEDHIENHCPTMKGKDDSELSQEDRDKKNRGKEKDKMDKQQAHYDKMHNAGTGGRRRGNAQQGQFTRANYDPYLLNNPYLLDFI